jgi:uncharacterized protein YjiS (DUF1127 family)
MAAHVPSSPAAQEAEMAVQTRGFTRISGIALHIDTRRLRRAWAALRRHLQEAALRRRLMDEDPRTLADLGISRAQAEFQAGHSWRHDLLR